MQAATIMRFERTLHNLIFLNKIKEIYVISGWEVRMVKNCDLGLENAFQDRGHSFSPYGPPSRQITYLIFLKLDGILSERN